MHTRRFVVAALIAAGVLLPSRPVAAQVSVMAASAAPLPAADAPTVASEAASVRMPVQGGAITIKVTDFLAARQKVLDAVPDLERERVQPAGGGGGERDRGIRADHDL